MEPRNDTESLARRAEARRDYKNRAKQAGVFRVVNKANGRVLLGSGLDLHAPLNRVAFELDMGVCWNAELRRDLARHGRETFVIEVLETIEPRDDPDFDPARVLEALERKHLALLDCGPLRTTRTTAFAIPDSIGTQDQPIDAIRGQIK